MKIQKTIKALKLRIKELEQFFDAEGKDWVYTDAGLRKLEGEE